MDIDIIKYINKESIILNFKKANNKKSVISAILDSLIETKTLNKKEKRNILKAVMQREEMGSTAIGGGIALPHTRVSSIKEAVISFLISYEGIDFESLDDEPVYVIAFLLSNQNEAGLHLKILAFLARLLRDKYFILNQLRCAKSKEEIVSLIANRSKSI